MTTANLVTHYVVLLALAWVLETPVYLLMLRRHAPVRRLVLIALMLNVLTNPLANLLYLRWAVPVAMLEAGVIVVEGGLLAMLLDGDLARAAWASLVANLASWFVGAQMYRGAMRLIGQLIT